MPRVPNDEYCQTSNNLLITQGEYEMLDRFVLLLLLLLATSSNQSSKWTPAAQEVFVELVEKAIIWLLISIDLPSLLSCWNYVQGIGQSDCEEDDQGGCSKDYEYLN